MPRFLLLYGLLWILAGNVCSGQETAPEFTVSLDNESFHIENSTEEACSLLQIFVFSGGKHHTRIFDPDKPLLNSHETTSFLLLEFGNLFTFDGETSLPRAISIILVDANEEHFACYFSLDADEHYIFDKSISDELNETIRKIPGYPTTTKSQ